jgi:putative DNA methylase
MDSPFILPKKLIEVALPLDAINEACAKEKSIRHGHPSTLHLWWARRPLAAARAVVFSQLVNDPEDLWRCQNPGREPNSQIKGHWTKSRDRLFALIEQLVKWENTDNSALLEKARIEIRKSWKEICDLNKNHPQAGNLFRYDNMPGLHDPFAGGGTIPLEAQRLGLVAYASDLNPVAVLINKATIEIPSNFSGQQPVNIKIREEKTLIDQEWRNATGLAEDVRYYGRLMRDEVYKRVLRHYPKVEITQRIVDGRPELSALRGQKFNVVAWLWARTVKSPSPVFSAVNVPLVTTFVLSNRAGKEAYVQPIIDDKTYEFEVKFGPPTDAAKAGTKAGLRAGFRCLVSQAPISYEYIRNEASEGRLSSKLMAIVADGPNGRLYLPPCLEHEVASCVTPLWRPELDIVPGMSERVVGYGFTKYADIFTSRQLVTLTNLCDVLVDIRARIRQDFSSQYKINSSGKDEAFQRRSAAYSEAIVLYLAFAISKSLDRNTSLCTWEQSMERMGHTFQRQALPMTWDYVETNPFAGAGGDFYGCVHSLCEVLDKFVAGVPGVVCQRNASTLFDEHSHFVSTDPPYYDNIGYADLSDFFYVWLRKSLQDVFPDLLATISVPKLEELVATPIRHGSKSNAEKFFLDGMTEVMSNLKKHAHPSAPITIYYAFKQSETKNGGTGSTGWETFLEAVNRSGLAVTGTWPMRTELSTRSVSRGTNSLASSIILVCKPKLSTSKSISRRDFIRELNATLPRALDAMTRESEGLHSPVAPVDLSQAIIGPGMAVFSQYAAVLEADGAPMSVKTALQLINRFLAEDDFDADTQFCLHWFEHHGWDVGRFGDADTLARAKGTSVDGVKQGGVIQAAAGNVRLLRWAEYPNGWEPKSDQRIPIWEVLHQLIRVFNIDGETGAAEVFTAVQSKAEAARQLAYRLYTLCERKNWAEDARAYNEIVTSWSGIESAALKEPTIVQRELFDN